MSHRRVQDLGDVLDGVREKLMGEVVGQPIGESRAPRVAVGAEQQGGPLAP